MPHKRGVDEEWRRVKTPFSVDLFDVVQAANGQYAVGGGGTVAADVGDGWEVIVPNGPSGESSKLHAIDATNDGRRVWFVGSSGALGMYDTKKGKKYDHSYPGDATTSWREVAVSGTAGEERGILANGSGVVVPFEVSGTEVEFGQPTEPGQGANIQSLEATSDGIAYAVDAAGAAYMALPGGWQQLPEIPSQVSLEDVYADPSGEVLVAAADGRLYRYGEQSDSWTPIDVARNALLSVDVFQGHVVVLASGSTIYWRPTEGGDWRRVALDLGNELLALALGYPDIAVGKSGTIVERPPAETPPRKHEKGKKEKKGKHGKPPEKTHEHDPLPACELLVEELVTRLETEELVELLELAGCTGGFATQIAEVIEGRRSGVESLLGESEVALLPVLAELEGRECHERGHAHECECHGHERERDCCGHERKRECRGHEHTRETRTELLDELERLLKC